MEELKSAFLAAIKAKTPDFEKAKAILGMGFDINTVESWGDSILEACLLDISSYSDECDSCDSDACRTCEYNRVAQLMPIVEFFIENGWDTVAYGLNCVASLVHTTHDKQMFYAAKRILECPLLESEKGYEAALKAIGTEKAFKDVARNVTSRKICIMQCMSLFTPRKSEIRLTESIRTTMRLERR